MALSEFENAKSFIDRWTNEAQMDQQVAQFPDLNDIHHDDVDGVSIGQTHQYRYSKINR
jgi:hypothetical protein